MMGCSALTPPDLGGCGSRQLHQRDVDGSQAAAEGEIVGQMAAGDTRCPA